MLSYDNKKNVNTGVDTEPVSFMLNSRLHTNYILD